MKIIAALALATTLLLPAAVFAQGSLTPPPGAPAPAMKTLDQIDAKLEKRTPVSSVPFIIDTPGSYYFTSNLTTFSAGDGITIAADNVTLDLNGFTLSVGPFTPDTHHGISVTSAQRNLCVRNGTISGWVQSGISAVFLTGGQFENLRLSNNGVGLDAAKSTVKNCTAISNASTGMGANDCTITDCIAQSNGSFGFHVEETSLSSCIASNNATGIEAFAGTLSGCNSSQNSGRGISVVGTSVIGCTALSNGVGIFALAQCTVSGCTVNYSGGNGITAQGDCLILNNNCNGNGISVLASGIAGTGGGNRIEGNTVTRTVVPGNGIAVAGGGNLIIRNSATGNTANFSGITASDSAGPVVTSATIGANNNPNANFSF